MVSTSSACVYPAQYRTREDQCDKSSVGQSHVKNSGRESLNEQISISFVLRGVEQEDLYIFFIFCILSSWSTISIKRHDLLQMLI